MKLFFISSFTMMVISTGLYAALTEPVKCLNSAPYSLAQNYRIALCSDTEDAEYTLNCYREAPYNYSVTDRVRLCSRHPEIISGSRAESE